MFWVGIVPKLYFPLLVALTLLIGHKWLVCLCVVLQLPNVQEKSDNGFPITHHNLLSTELPGCVQ